MADIAQTDCGVACLFCGRPASGFEFAEEDVVPKWLLRYLELPAHDKSFHGVGTAATEELTAFTVESSFRFREPRVCKVHCNNGWMSRLEKAAIPILKPLMDASRQLRSLDHAERTILGKWAAKTAYLHAVAKPVSGTRVPVEHFQALSGDAGAIAPGVGVFAAHAPYEKNSTYYQRNYWPEYGLRRSADAESMQGAYKVAIQFRCLCLLVAFWPDTRSEFVPAFEQYPVWPLHDEWFFYDGLPLVGDTHPLIRHLANLMVSHNSKPR